MIGSDDATGDIKSDQERILRDIHGIIRNAQVILNKLECAPSWITTNALQQDHDDNWADSYVEVEEKVIPKESNVICSHVVYKVKTE